MLVAGHRQCLIPSGILCPDWLVIIIINYRNIINIHVNATDPDSVVNLIIFYRNRKTSQLIMKNPPPADSNPLKRHGVVYRILCPANGCNHSYIGMTTTVNEAL